MYVKILAVDPGTANSGYATIAGNLLSDLPYLYQAFGVIKTFKHCKGFEVSLSERIDFIANELTAIIKKTEPTHFVFEDFVEQGVRAGKTYKDMAYLIERLRTVGKTMQLDTTVYSNRVWKRRLMRASTVNKAQVEHYISHVLPEAKKLLQGQPDHVWDAMAIGYCKWKELQSAIVNGKNFNTI